MNDDLNYTLKILKEGGVVLYPTDTVWGIGCDATNSEAVAKIYKIKQREDAKSMIILVDSLQMIFNYVKEIPDIALQLIETNDKPMTLVYPGAENLAGNLINHDGSIGIRITSDEFCKKLIGKFRKPIVSTSANLSGKKHPGNFSEIEKTILNQVDYIVKWMQNDKARPMPSSIIKVGLKGEIEILRR
ncbi:MAG: threonylcarbamoyl-AMP synthase [Bacteroidia bacterium]|nr:threonylcarbamoyl-AMP synthase [Bacteroidia bacterium]